MSQIASYTVFISQTNNCKLKRQLCNDAKSPHKVVYVQYFQDQFVLSLFDRFLQAFYIFTFSLRKMRWHLEMSLCTNGD